MSVDDLSRIAAAVYQQFASTGQPVRYQWGELTLLFRLTQNGKRYELVTVGPRQLQPAERAELLQAFRIPRNAREYNEVFNRTQQVTRWTWARPAVGQLPLL